MAVRGRVAEVRLEQEPGQDKQDHGARKGVGLFSKNKERPPRLLKKKRPCK